MTRQDDRSKASPSTAVPAKAGTRLRPTRSLLALETRIVFDGAVQAVVADGHEGAAGVMHKAIAGAAEVARTAALTPERAPVDTTAKAATPTTILFIDASVANPAALLIDLKPGVEVVMLDKNSDGVRQIADALKGRHGLDSIQIISEGNDGRVLLGSATLADSNIDQYQAALAGWGSALRAGGDILLFGCDVAKSAIGEHFVDRMAALTGADVAASSDATGAAALGGNWVLEKHTGAIEADKAIGDRAVADFDSLLLTGNGTADGTYDFGGTLGAASNGFKTLNDKFLISSSLVNEGSNVMYIDPALYPYTNGPGNPPDGVGTSATVVIKAEGGNVNKSFTFNDFTFSTYMASAGDLKQFTVVLADAAGNTLATYNKPAGNYTLPTTGTKLSVIANGGAPISVANVASVSITFAYITATPAEMTFESIAVANIRATATTNTAPTFVGAVTTLNVPQNGGTFDIRNLLHASDSDAGQTLTWSVSSPAGHGTVSLSGATGASGSTDITPGGTFTYMPTAGYAGTDAFTVRVSDGTATTTRTINVTVTPGTPGTPDLAAGTDTGASQTDNITNASSLSFSGTSAANDTTSIVRAFLDVNANGVYDAGTDAAASATVNNGAWTVSGLSTTGLADGVYNVYATTTSAIGNVSSTRSTGLAVTIDKTAPGTPTTPIIIAPFSDSGSSNSDGITKITGPLTRTSLAGTNAVAGNQVELMLNGSSFGTPLRTTLTVTDVSNGYVDIQVPTGGLGADGVKLLTARVIDAAGNAGMDAGTFTLTLDTTIAAPSAPVLAAASDSGSSNSDRITNVTTPTLTGTAEAGSTVTLYDTNGTTVLGTGVATGGAWQITSSALSNGAHTLSVKATDVAGNVSSTSASVVVIIDATRPATPPAPTLDPASDNGASNADRITSVTTPVINGTAESGSIVRLYDSDGTTVLGTAVATGGIWSITSSTLADGVHNLTVTSTDAAGNTSLYSSALQVTIATAAAAPAGLALTAASDSGASNADAITNVTMPTITGTALAGSIVTLYDTDGTTVLGSITAVGGTWSITTTVALADGTHNLTAKAVDGQGNASAASSALSITIDTTAPGTPATPVLAAASDSGASNSDGITRITTPVFSGTADAGSLVTLYDTDGTTVLGTAVATGGVWSITSSTLAQGAHSLTVKATDVAGNTSTASAALAITIDTSAPGAPAAPTMAAASDSGASNSDGITRITTPVFAGTAEAGSTVLLFDTNGTTVLGSAVATGGVWSITSTTLAQGAHSLSVKAIDTAGNTSVASNSLAITIDTTAPLAPAAPVLAAASDSGASNSDGITRITTPVVAGTAEAGSTVLLFDTNGTTVLGSAVATGGVWSITSSTLAQGAHSLTVKAIDTAGNTSTASAALVITIDTTAPLAPAAPTMAAASDSGASNSDGITRITTPVFSGTAEAGSTVLLYDTNGTTVLGSAVATGGVWSITSTTLTQGAHSLTVKAIDTAGNTSTASSALAITIDTTAPLAPAAPVLAAASDSGASNTDGITRITTPVFAGTAEAGSTILLYDTNGTTVLGSAVATGGVWSITSSTLAQGAHSLTAKAIDSAGNTSAASSALAITIDTTAPVTPAAPVLAAASDSGASNSDGVTRITTPVVAGTAEAGSLVTLYDTDGTTVLGTTVATGGVWSITSSTLSPGAHSLTVKSTDTAGNTSAASGALAITIDTTAPVTPAAPVLAAASDSGASNSDGITRITTPVLAGTAEAGSLVTLYDTDGTTVLGTTVATGGVWSITSSTLANGAHSLTVKATDVAGNTSAVSAALAITIDTTAPLAPAAPVLAAASDSGASNTDGITRITTPVFAGTAEAGSTVLLFDTNGTTVLGSAVATGGVWSITSSTLTQGAHSLTVKAIDTAGNTSAASSALAITIDTTAPVTPAAPVLAAASDSGASNSDGITRITTPVVAGTAEAGSLVTLYDTDGTTVLGTAVATGGVWSITSSTLAPGAHSVTVKSTDIAGNTSAASNALAITIDTTAPATPAAPTMAAASDSGASNADGITRITTPVFSGTAEAGSLVTLYDTDGTTVLGTTVATGGVWSITSSTLAQGAHSLTVRTTDTVGNTSAASNSLAITIDTTAPGAPAAPVLAAASDSGASNSDGITRITTPVIAGTAEAGSTVLLYDTNGTTVLGSAVATGGIWSITSTTLAQGAHSLTVKAIDTAGNTSAASSALAITIDTTAPVTPAAPVLAAASDSGASNSDGITRITTPVVAGTAEAGSLVTLYDTDGTTVLGTAVATGGVWSITSSTLANGAHSLTVKSLDAAGNTSAASQALAITIDTTAPATPAAPTMAAASDSGASNTDGITRITTPVIAGTAEAGSLVTLYDTDGTTVLGTAVATGGVWSITSSTLAQGAHSLTVKAVDTAGNTSVASAALAIIIDTTAPDAPAAPVLAAASDSGASNTDGITRITTPVIAGTAEAGSLVTLYDTDGTTVLGTAVATGGVWSITSSTLAAGAHSLTVKSTDTAGNTSAASQALAITIDTTAPITPAVPVLAAASDSGASNSDGITRITTPVIAGTAEAGSLVTLYDTDGTTVLGTAVATGGVWSITSSTLAQGAHSLTVKAVDTAGNTSAASSALSITIDTTAPSAPAAPTLAAASDSGASNTDGITRITTPVFAGTAEAGSLVTLYDTDGTTVLGTAVATGGVWSITSSTLANGVHSLTVKAIDTAGNTSVASAALAVTVDTTAPVAPAAPTLAAASDSGFSNTDRVTSVTTPTFTGTAEAGSTVTLYDTDGTTVLGTTTATGGAWSITSSPLAQGAHSVTVKAVDAAGNASAASPAAAITIDTTAPAAPSAPTLSAGSDTGASSGDGITNNTLLTFNGTAAANSFVTLYDTDGITELGTTIATGGLWHMTIFVRSEGTHSITARAVDIAGNTSAASAALVIIIDGTAPAVPGVPTLSAASDSGASNADGITNVATPVFTGTAEAGSTVTLYDTDGATVLGTTVATGGVWNITSSALAQGTHSLTVKAVDAAGNASAASPALAVTIDTTAPAAPAAPAMLAASDAGLSGLDRITNITTPTFTGTAEAGSTVTLYDTDGTTVLGATTAVGGVWTITSSTLGQGLHQVTVKATDTAGNTSAASASTALTIDTTAPVAPGVLTLQPGSDSGISPLDNITRVTTPSFTGTAETNSLVRLYDTDGTTVLGFAYANGGIWRIVSTALADGVHNLSVRTTDIAGNESPASPILSITIDTAAPAAPAAPALLAASDSGAPDGVTSITTPVFTGTAEAGSTVRLYDTDGATVLGTTVATGGVWTITSSALAQGAHSVTVKAVDVAGNTSAASPALAITIDTAAPATPTVASMGGITSIATPTVNGTAEAGSTVTLYDTDGTTVLGTTVATGGTWTITTSVLAEGAHALTVKATDIAGNTSAASAALAITIDTTAPVAPTVATAGGITSNTTPTLTGTAEAGSTITVFDTDGVTVLGTTIATGGTWTITTSVLTEGAHALTVEATDSAGNTSAASTALAITIDTTAPAAPTVATAGGITSITTPTLTGTAEAGSTVTLFDTDGVTVLGTTIATGGTWTITTSVLAEGAHTLTVKATDSAGNTSVASAALAVTIDTTAPGVPTVATMGGITRIPTPTLTGTAEAGSTITLFDTDGVTVLGTTIATGGTWTITTSGLAEGAHALTVKATDSAGNTSAASAALAITIDTAAPATPTVATTGGVTRITTPTLTGTAEAGSTIALLDTDGVTVLGTTIATGGTWTITTSVLAEGTHTLTVKATDTAGNTSVASTAVSVTIDTTAPGAPTVATSGGVTRVTTPTLTGTAEAGSTITLFDTDGVTVLGTTTATGGTWTITSRVLAEGAHALTVKAFDAAGNTSAASTAVSFTIDTTAPRAPTVASTGGVTSITRPTLTGTAEAGSTVTLFDTDGVTVLGTTVATGGAWTITSTVLGEGAHALTVKATDSAGNTGAASAAVAITVDTTAPAAPTMAASAGVTRVATPTFTGTAEAGSTITLFDTDGVTMLGTTIATGGTWSITSSVLADGVHRVSVRALDAAGNASAASTARAITIDTTAPAAPTVANVGGILATRTPTVTGTAEAGSTVTLYDSNGSTVLGSAVAVNGNWSITSSALGEGSHTLTVRAVDAAGNASAASRALAIVVDTTAPLAAGTPQLPDGTASTLDTVPTLTGSAEANSTVTVRSNGTVIGTVQADATGTWRLTAQLSLGTHDITATAVDAAGNTGATSPALHLTILAPPAPVVTAPLPPAPPVLAPLAQADVIATPPVREAAQGQVSQSPLATAIQAAVPQATASFETAVRLDNAYVAPAPLPTLVVSKPIGDFTVDSGMTMRFVVPADTFVSGDGSAPALSARLADGSPLPAWIRFDPATGTFTGTPPAGVTLLEIEVVAKDANGIEVRSIFKVQTGAPQASLVGNDLLLALGLQKHASAPPVAAPADATPGNALSEQLSHEAQRFARAADATLRHLANI